MSEENVGFANQDMSQTGVRNDVASDVQAPTVDNGTAIDGLNDEINAALGEQSQPQNSHDTGTLENSNSDDSNITVIQPIPNFYDIHTRMDNHTSVTEEARDTIVNKIDNLRIDQDKN